MEPVMASKFAVSKEELARHYKTKSTEEIGDEFGVCAEVVRRKLHEFGIKPRKRGAVREFNPPKKELENLYQQHSMKAVSRIYGVGETVVWKRLKEHGITLRDYEDGGHRKKPGREFSVEHRANMRKAQLALNRSGENGANWRGGASIKNLLVRRTGAYRDWKRKALEKAGYKCEGCGVAHKKICECCGTQTMLHVHHVKPFATHVEDRFDPNNSEVLCPKCHRSRHK